MNPEVKEKWTQALRSDEYDQTTNQLRHEENKRCCLGVLCDLYADENKKAHWDGHQFFDGKHTETATLPPKVLSWAGIDEPSGDYIPVAEKSEDYERVTLADLNDGFASAGIEQHSFDEIADLIEKHL